MEDTKNQCFAKKGKDFQEEIVSYLRGINEIKGLFFAIPEVRYFDDMGRNKQLVQQGYLSNLPTLFLSLGKAKYNGLYLLLKQKRAKVKEEEFEILENLKNQGYMISIIFNYDDAVKVIDRYINLN